MKGVMTMKFGVMMFVADYSIGPAELARAADERGFEWLLLPEHTHIPASRRTPSWPIGPEMPREYAHSLHQFVAQTASAAATDRSRIGTAICSIVQHDPITVAKAVASLDVLSNGRLIFGISGSWNIEEMENQGADPARRWQGSPARSPLRRPD